MVAVLKVRNETDDGWYEFGHQGPQGFRGYQGYQGSQGNQGYQGDQGVVGNQGAMGEPGPQGLAGVQGIEGAQGFQGVQGNQGSQGAIGSTGSTGAQGNQGNQGYQGHQGVVGAQGSVGAIGPQGNQGHQGPTGANGVDGATGAQGVQGSIGVTGAQGAQGVQGARGYQGIEGAQGSQGSVGIAGLVWKGDWVAATYAVGDVVYYDGSSYVRIVAGASSVIPPSDPTKWDLLSQVGALGPQGQQGVVGATGSQGQQGVVGATGSQGATGAQGSQGVVGATGPTGPQGLQGLRGYQGLTGATGSQGPIGVQGPTGPQGTQGRQGSQGNTGPTGSQGAQGPQGLLGDVLAHVVGVSTTGRIYQGTGTWGSTFTGSALWSEGAAPNTKMLIGGWNAGVKQWYGSSDGKFYAGGGAVKLDSAGISLTVPEGGYTDAAEIQFMNGTATVLQMGAYKNVSNIYSLIGASGGAETSLKIESLSPSNQRAFCSINAYNGVLADLAQVWLQSAPSDSQVSISGKLVEVTGDVYLHNRIRFYNNTFVSTSAGGISLDVQQGRNDIVFLTSAYSSGYGFRFYEPATDGNLRLAARGNSTTWSDMIIFYHDKNFWLAANCSALSFTDRTPYYEGDALAEIKNIKSKKNSKGVKEIDHSTLPRFAHRQQIDEDGTVTEERDLGAMISILTVAVQQLDNKIIKHIEDK